VAASGRPLIEVHGLTKVYGQGADKVEALRGLDLMVCPGELVAITGPSGSGKSTLMHVLGCLDRATQGSYLLDGVEVGELDDVELARIRNHRIGFVFQTFNLLARTSALENVELPLVYGRQPDRRERALTALEQVGLGDRVRHRPNELSGGQQQRVAIARALITNPEILLADEPTGNLDRRSGLEILAIFKRLHRDGRTILVVTHDQAVAEHADRVIVLKEGTVAEDRNVAQPRDAEEETQALADEEKTR